MANSRVVLGAVCLLALAACDRGADTAGPSCETVAKQIIATLAGGENNADTMVATIATAKTCTDTKWPAAARSCFAKAQSKDALRACEHDTLTGAQVDKLDDAAGSVSSASTKAVFKKFQEFTDKMCACKDAKCAQGVSDEMTKWGQEMSRAGKEPPRMSEEDTNKFQELGKRMGECMTKAMSADMPTRDDMGGSGNANVPDGSAFDPNAM